MCGGSLHGSGGWCKFIAVDCTPEPQNCPPCSAWSAGASFAGAGVEQSTTNRPSDALLNRVTDGRAHPTAPANTPGPRVSSILAGLRAVRGLHLRSEWEREYQLSEYERAVREAEASHGV
jgi:hypothetical protein